MDISNSEDYFAITHFHVPIKVDVSDVLPNEEYDLLELENVSDIQNVGYISASRFDRLYDKKDLYFIADSKNSDVAYFASFLLIENDLDNEFDIFASYLFYIEKVFIEPEYRGRGYGLKGLSIFLRYFAGGQIVGCHPCPIDDLREKYSEEQGKKLMKRYWSKLGFKKYDNVID